MLDVDALLRPYLDSLSEEVGDLALYDAHTHVGANDPDGFTQTPEQLLQALAPARARGVVFPMHEPEGYRARKLAELDAKFTNGQIAMEDYMKQRGEIMNG